ncbi:MAG: ABC transporter permease, partial [Oscillibacter sp.]|nr:ABC transporter permease [Oscillibacter sp.]
MKTALAQALALVLSGDAQLLNIISTTLKMSISSSLSALLIGVPAGVFLAVRNFPGRRFFVVWNRTMMGLPPVVCGLICYILFSGTGPLRRLHLLYTVRGMVIAQFFLILPIVVGTLEAFAVRIVPDVRESVFGMGLSRGKYLSLVMNECRYQIVSAYLMAFSRAIAEVGAVSMVGGAIAYKTNVMTTAIM